MKHATISVIIVVAIVVALLIGAPATVAQSLRSTDKQSDGRFTGIAIITDDIGWYELFKRPETPRIRGQDRFGPRKTGALAIIFSNAEPRDGTVRIECDVTAFDPDGSSVVVNAGVCYEGPYFGDNVLHPALLDIRFDVSAEDPPGRSGFEIALRDTASRRSVSLTVDFMQNTGE
jgi:hypothetical protein